MVKSERLGVMFNSNGYDELPTQSSEVIGVIAPLASQTESCFVYFESIGSWCGNAVKLPNRQRAVIAPAKLTEYLLNVEHQRGGTKARLLVQFGYTVNNWQQLEADIRQYHLLADVDVM